MERTLIVLQRAKSTSPFPASSQRPRQYSSTRNVGEKSLSQGRRARPSNHAPRQSNSLVDALSPIRVRRSSTSSYGSLRTVLFQDWRGTEIVNTTETKFWAVFRNDAKERLH